MAEAYLSGHFLSYCSGLVSKLIGGLACSDSMFVIAREKN